MAIDLARGPTISSDMLSALIEVYSIVAVPDKNQRLAELYLLLYYDQGFAYNTPFDAPGFGFNEVARQLRTAAAVDHGVFDRVFLFVPATADLATIYP